MSFNPIVKRDITVGSRSTQLAVLITVMNGLLLGVDLLGIFGRLSRYRLEKVIDYRAMLDVYLLAAGVIFVIVLFLYPALTVGSVTTERESGTLDLMLASGLSPLRILFGKLSAKLLPGIVLLASFLPGLILPLFFGGIGIQSAGLYLVLLAPLALELLCAGLYAGTKAKNGSMAALLAYGIVLGITVLPVLCAALFGVFAGDGGNRAAYVLVLCPAAPAAKLILGQVGEEKLLLSVLSRLRTPDPSRFEKLLIPAGVGTQLIMSAVFFFLSVTSLVPEGRKGNRKRKTKQLQSPQN